MAVLHNHDCGRTVSARRCILPALEAHRDHRGSCQSGTHVAIGRHEPGRGFFNGDAGMRRFGASHLSFGIILPYCLLQESSHKYHAWLISVIVPFIYNLRRQTDGNDQTNHHNHNVSDRLRKGGLDNGISIVRRRSGE